MNLYSIILSILFLIGSLTAANATVYYVSTTGSDRNNGLSQAHAFQHLQTAAGFTEPGDTVMVMSGTYSADPKHETGSALIIYKSGTAAQPISYRPYTGNHVVIASSNNTIIYDTVTIAASYINFVGFEVIGHAQYVTLSRATTEAKAEENNYLNSVKAHNSNPSVPIAYPRDSLTNGNCIYISSVSHITVESNIVHDCSSSGINSQQSDYLRIQSNTVFNTSWWSVYDTSGIDIHYMLNFDNHNTGYRNYIMNNISHDSGNTQAYYNPAIGKGVPTDGNGIIIDTNQHTNDGKPYIGRTLLMGNIVYHNGGTGMHTYLSSHVDIFNNTAFNNNNCPVSGSSCGNLSNAEICANYSNDVNIYNNILITPSGRRIYTDYANTAVSEDYNLFYSLSGSPVFGNYKANTHDIVKGPAFNHSNDLLASSQAPRNDAYDIAHPLASVQSLGLAIGSPARNKGTLKLDNGTPINAYARNGNRDTRIDIGAVSYVAP